MRNRRRRYQRSQTQPKRVHSRLIAANIRARRKSLNISQKQLSMALGYDDTGKFFHRVESEGQSIPAEYMPAIAEELNVEDFRRFYEINAFTE